MSKLKLPEWISKEMDLYRNFDFGLPDSYVKYHTFLATFDAVVNSNFTILEWKGLVRDGWIDGMKVVQILVLTKDDEEMVLEWSDSHGEGAWFEALHGKVRRFEMSEETRKHIETKGYNQE